MPSGSCADRSTPTPPGRAIGADDATWLRGRGRGRGRALSMALGHLDYYSDTNPVMATTPAPPSAKFLPLPRNQRHTLRSAEGVQGWIDSSFCSSVMYCIPRDLISSLLMTVESSSRKPSRSWFTRM